MNKTFESQLSASARRMRKQSESAVGLLIGLFIHRPAERQDNFTVPVVVASDNSGHSIVEDGTDYSLLVSL